MQTSHTQKERKKKKKKLKVFRSTRSDEDTKEYVKARKRYIYPLKAKKQSFRREKTTLLAANLNNPSTFWKELRNMGCGKQSKANSSNTDINEWYDHFKDLLPNNDTNDNVHDASQFDNSEESDHFLSKCYTSVLNARLYFWLEENAAITECQSGFRKNYSTVDQTFNLYATVKKCLRKKGQKLYVAFVDFWKAFDSVRHDELSDCIKNQRIKGKFFGALRAMYNSLLSCIRANCKYSEFFECPVGVRQGCVLSPTLFSLFINQPANHVTAKARHGIQLVPGVMELFILLFADDVALLSTTATGLQNQIVYLITCCQEMKMEVNKDKAKIMVSRKGGFLAKHEKNGSVTTPEWKL